MSKPFTYIQGGKIGDFIHSLCICKYNYETKNRKADIFIVEGGDRFEKPLLFTYHELKPILERQKWVNSFNIYNGENIDYPLVNFRSGILICRTNWIEIYFKQYLNIDNPPKEYSWIDVEGDDSLKDTVLVNRNMNNMSDETTEKYREILKNYEKVSFICFDKKQYDNFKLKDSYPVIYVNDLHEFFKKIKGCKLFVGNQSAPAAIATSMNIPRIIELYAKIDYIHYLNDVNYYSNFKYFVGDCV